VLLACVLEPVWGWLDYLLESRQREDEKIYCHMYQNLLKRGISSTVYIGETCTDGVGFLVILA